MLSPKQMLEIADTMWPVLDELQTWITEDMISRLMARMGRGEAALLSATDKWQLEVYKAAGGHLEAVQKEIQKFTKKSDKEVKEIFEDAGIKAWEAEDAFFVAHGAKSASLGLSENMIRILADIYDRTKGEIHNFTRTTATASQAKLYSVLDEAHFKVMTGAQSYSAAVQEAVDQLCSTQATVAYPSGHVDTIETAVLRAVRTGVAQATGNMTLQVLEERDWDLIRVSAHLGARTGDGGENPGNHFWWQGKLYSRTGTDLKYPDFKKATGYGTGEGLCGYNCRHSFGAGDPNHNPYAEYDEEENRKAYELSQQQRKIERSIRNERIRARGYREAIDSCEDETVRTALQEKYDRSTAKLAKLNKKYQDFCKENNLKPQHERMQAARKSRPEAVEAVRATRQNAASVMDGRVSATQQSVIGAGNTGTDLQNELRQYTNNRLGAGSGGSGEVNNTDYLGQIDPANTDEVIEYYNEIIRNQENENAIIIDRGGNVYYAKGSSTGVSFEGIDLSGATITHNHPESNGIVSFGKDDFYFLKEHQDIRAMWCVNAEYTYKIRILKDISKVVYNEIYCSGSIFYESSDFEIQDAAIQVLKERGYVEYEKIRYEP